MTTETDVAEKVETDTKSPADVMFAPKVEPVVEDKTVKESDDSADHNSEEASLLSEEEDVQAKDQDTDTGDENKDGDPIVYDLKLPEDALIDDSAKDSIQEFAQKHKLTNDVAQEILDRENSVLRLFEEKRVAEGDALIKKEIAGWKKEILEDPELGGENTKAVDAKVTALLKAHAPEGFVESLRESGLNFNPLLLRFFYNIAKIASPDSFRVGGNGQNSSEDLSLAERLFPNAKL